MGVDSRSFVEEGVHGSSLKAGRPKPGRRVLVISFFFPFHPKEGRKEGWSSPKPGSHHPPSERSEGGNGEQRETTPANAWEIISFSPTTDSLAHESPQGFSSPSDGLQGQPSAMEVKEEKRGGGAEGGADGEGGGGVERARGGSESGKKGGE